MLYKAFISYSHAADGELAPALQAALHRFTKPWYRLRAMRVFRDDTGLGLTPALWPEIERALNESEHFLLLASPQAAQSRWVTQEVDHWLRHRSSNTLHIIWTQGNIKWKQGASDFDWTETDALPSRLEKAFKQEPLYLDFRWARTSTDLSLRNPEFLNAIATVAAPLHGKPKDELTGEDIRQFRKTRQVLQLTIGTLLTLTLIASVATIVSIRQSREAKRERDQAQANAYDALVGSARLLLETSDYQGAQDLLSKTPPSLRNWEWSYFSGLADRSIGFVPLNSDMVPERLPSDLFALTPSAQGSNTVFSSFRLPALARLTVSGDCKNWIGAMDPPRRQVAMKRGNEILIWNAAKGTWNLFKRLDGSVGEGGAELQFSPDGTLLALLDEQIYVWGINNGRTLVQAARPLDQTDVLLRFSESGRYFAAAGNDLRVWDLHKTNLVLNIPEESSKPLTDITALYIDEESSTVVYAADSYDYGVNSGPRQFEEHIIRRVRIGQGDTVEEIFRKTGPAAITAVTVTPPPKKEIDPPEIIVAGSGDCLRLLDASTGDLLSELAGNVTTSSQIVLARNRKDLLTVTSDGHIRGWKLPFATDPISEAPKMAARSWGEAPFLGIYWLVSGIQFSPSENSVLLYGAIEREPFAIVHNVNASTNLNLQTDDMPDGDVASIAYSNDGRFLFGLSAFDPITDSSLPGSRYDASPPFVNLWDAHTGKKLAKTSFAFPARKPFQVKAPPVEFAAQFLSTNQFELREQAGSVVANLQRFDEVTQVFNKAASRKFFLNKDAVFVRDEKTGYVFTIKRFIGLQLRSLALSPDEKILAVVADGNANGGLLLFRAP
jgi:WD40 repeat protein